MDILIGTKNAYKAGEMKYFLADIPGVVIHEWDELDLNIKVEENQSSLVGNAEKKARKISALTDYYVLTSDSGNDIPGLGDRWDILRNQRIVGENSTDREKVQKIMSLMDGLKGEERLAEEHFALALGYKGEVIWSAEDTVDTGYIVEMASEDEIPPYKWMGHVWYYPDLGKTYNNMTDSEVENKRKRSSKLRSLLKEKIEGILQR
jgi:inosine/xanthosine triphosphate pyrophosphatase family protein